MEAVAEEDKKNFNVYVGSERGILKGAYFGGETPVLKNFGGASGDANNANSISCLNWSPVGESQQLIVGHQDGLVKFYNPKLRSFTHDIQLDLKSNLVGAFEVSEGNLAVGLKNGKLNVFNTEKEENSAEITTGQELSIIRQLKSSPSVLATGGKENDLKIYDLSSESLEPTFKARNIPHDFLDLRVPVWVQDLTFVNESTELVSIVSRHGHLRLYDVKSSNRPVVNFQVLEDEALMAVADTGQAWQVVVGGNKGSMALADIRYPGKGRLVHKFTAAAGSVRSIDFQNNYITACGLDRHLYLYNLYEKKAVKKLYLKTRLTKVIMTDEFRFGTGKRTDSSWQNIEGEVIIKKKKTS